MRLYRWLLRLFPRRFRRERGEEMERLVRDMRAERRRRGRSIGLGFWIPLLHDTLLHAAREWHARSGSPPSPTPISPVTRCATDLRAGLRSLVRRPGWSLMIVFMMAASIAGTAAVFRVFNGLFLRPLPFQDAERLVDLDETAPRWNLEFVGIAYPDFELWRRGAETFESMGVLTVGGANFAGQGDPVRITVVRASHDVDDVLRIVPASGRFFEPAEDHPDGPRVALLTQGFWERQFGGDPGVVGRTVRLDGIAHEVVGILPREASFVDAEVSVWVPLRESVDSPRGWYLSGFGRLRPGVTVEQARADLTAVHRGAIGEREVNEITSPVVHRLRDRYLGDYRLGSWVLLGAVGIVLLIACANIAGLTLARSLSRDREIAVRVAMGAGRRRIVDQLLAESLILALVGGALGTALGVWGSGALMDRMSEQFPSWVRFGLDGRFVAFSVTVTVGAALLFGLVPALQAAGVDPGRLLQGSSSRASTSTGKHRAMSLIVTAEVALALVLLVTAGLGVRDLLRLERTDPGYRTEGILTYRLHLPSSRYGDDEARNAFFADHLARVRALPGVEGAAGATALPLGGHWGMFYEADGAPERGPDEANPVVLTRFVTTGYFETMDVELVAGRVFDRFDGRDEGSAAVIVNETFARTFFPDPAAVVGRRIRPGDDSPWFTVVGVARDVKHYGVAREVRPGLYRPAVELGPDMLQLAVRTAGDPSALLAPVTAAVREADPELPVDQPRTMRRVFDDSLWTRRAASLLVAAFSTVALLLAVAGLYGVISYTVGQRVHEISIRMALGARKRQVLGAVVRQGMALVVTGVVVGLLTAVAVAGAVSRVLPGVDPDDPAVYGAVTLLLLAVAALANAIPARRAARLHPMKALRGE